MPEDLVRLGERHHVIRLEQLPLTILDEPGVPREIVEDRVIHP